MARSNIKRVVVVEQRSSARAALADALEREGFAVTRAADDQAALGILRRQPADLLVSADPEGGREARRLAPELMVVLIGDVQVAAVADPTLVDALRGPHEGSEPALLARVLMAALERKLARPNGAPAGGIVHRSPQMSLVAELTARVAVGDVNVLVSGESGVGKELVAQALHRGSRRAERPLVDVNCAALSETLMESELFGHEKGAYTGASARRVGFFEVADGGTLLLDEIGELPQPLQAKLLRVLETHKFYRVGGTTAVAADVRIVALTNRDLSQEVAAGRFRRDLYYRLNSICIQVPPLRERPEDVLPLARHFLQTATPGPAIDLSAEVTERLLAYDWPGNVRELKNAMESAVLLSGGGPIDACHLSRELRDSARKVQLSGTLQASELETIVAALRSEGWRRNRAAESLGISAKTLYRKIKQYGLEHLEEEDLVRS